MTYIPDTSLKIFSAAGVKTVSNTTTATSLVPTGTGYSSLARTPNYMTIGRTISMAGGGVITTPASSSITVGIYYNSTLIASAAFASGLFGALTNAGWNFDADLQCTATGTSGSVVANGVVIVNTNVLPIFSAGSVTVDTTAAATFDVRCTWDAASTTRSITTNTFEAESKM